MNSKVKNNRLSTLPNIGKVAAEKLNMAGVGSEEELRSIGTENAFIKLKVIDPDSCICSLYALEGAIQGVRWHNLSKERKEELKEFFDMVNRQIHKK